MSSKGGAPPAWASASAEAREWARGEGALRGGWRAAPRCGFELRPYGGMSRALAVSPCGSLLAAGCADCPARVWACGDGALVASVAGPSASAVTVACLCFLQPPPPAAETTDTPSAASAAPPLRLYLGWDSDVREVDPRTGHLRRALRGHRSHVKELRPHPSGALLFSLSEDQSCRAWRAADGTCTLILGGPGGAQVTSALTADGRWLFVSTARRSLAVWRTEDGTMHNELEGQDGVRRAPAF